MYGRTGRKPHHHVVDEGDDQRYGREDCNEPPEGGLKESAAAALFQSNHHDIAKALAHCREGALEELPEKRLLDLAYLGNNRQHYGYRNNHCPKRSARTVHHETLGGLPCGIRTMTLSRMSLEDLTASAGPRPRSWCLKDHISIRILLSGAKAQDKNDTRKHGLQDPYVMLMWSFGPLYHPGARLSHQRPDMAGNDPGTAVGLWKAEKFCCWLKISKITT